LEEIRELHKPMDYEALKKFQKDIDEKIMRRKEENKRKIREG
jgi:hypothetical protein